MVSEIISPFPQAEIFCHLFWLNLSKFNLCFSFHSFEISFNSTVFRLSSFPSPPSGASIKKRKRRKHIQQTLWVPRKKGIMMRIIYSHSETHYYFHGNRLWCSEHGTLWSSQEQDGKRPCSDSLSLRMLWVVTLGGSSLSTELSPKALAWHSRPSLPGLTNSGSSSANPRAPGTLAIPYRALCPGHIRFSHTSAPLPIVSSFNVLLPCSFFSFSLFLSANASSLC